MSLAVRLDEISKGLLEWGAESAKKLDVLIGQTQAQICFINGGDVADNLADLKATKQSLEEIEITPEIKEQFDNFSNLVGGLITRSITSQLNHHAQTINYHAKIDMQKKYPVLNDLMKVAMSIAWWELKWQEAIDKLEGLRPKISSLSLLFAQILVGAIDWMIETLS